MNEESCPTKGKKCALTAAIVAVAAGLIAWSLIALFKSAPQVEETFPEEEIEEELPTTTAPERSASPPETKTEKAE